MANNRVSSNKFRRGTQYSVEFPTFPSLTIQPRRVDLIQKQYHHDVLILEYIATSPLWFDNLKTGVPVMFSWSQGGHTESWPGYVSHTTKVVASQRENVMEVHCVSASYPLKENHIAVYTDMTIPQVVEQICREAGLKFVGDPHPRKFEQLIMAGSSHWEFIREQAKRIGYGLVVIGPTLFFRPLDRLIDQNGGNVPVLSLSQSDQVIRNKFLDKTLDYFKVLNGENIEDRNSRTVKTVAGVDPYTGKPVTSTTAPNEIGVGLKVGINDVMFSEQRTDQVVHSRVDAKATSEGLAHLGRFNMPAKVKGQGDPRIKPFFPVFLSGTGASTDGYWVVEEAHHMLHGIGDYQIELTVLSDGVGDTNYTALRTEPSSIVGVINITDAAVQ
jgi:phage protein D